MQAQISLRELQLRMRELIRRRSAFEPPSASGPSDAELLDSLPIRADERLDAAGRVAIYSGMYFARIRDAIAEDYAALGKALGGEGFEQLIQAYLDAHPPRHPSLRQAAAHLADFVARRRDLAPQPWHAPLARLEAAMVEAFDARDEEPLRAADLEALAAEEWSELALRPVASLVLLEPGIAIDRVREALLEGPPGDGDPCSHVPLLDARDVRLRVWRQGHTVFLRRVAEREARALQFLAPGASFGALCEWLDGEIAATSGRGRAQDGEPMASDELPDAAQEAVRLLRRWLDDELLVRPGAAER
jgi:putative DNA-binding protein